MLYAVHCGRSRSAAQPWRIVPTKMNCLNFGRCFFEGFFHSNMRFLDLIGTFFKSIPLNILILQFSQEIQTKSTTQTNCPSILIGKALKKSPLKIGNLPIWSVNPSLPQEICPTQMREPAAQSGMPTQMREPAAQSAKVPLKCGNQPPSRQKSPLKCQNPVS